MVSKKKSKKAKRAAKQQSIADAEGVKRARRQRWNPLRSLSPMTLTRALESLEYGDLREFAMLAETVAERDDVIKSVKPKREKSAAHRSWQILQKEKSKQAARHQEVLDEFWHNVRAENAYDRNECGGMRRLILQMMGAVSYRYAAHHIVWKPEPGKLRATFEFVPLWFFENREGRLRFVRDGVSSIGEDLDERRWMVTVGDGLMVACLVGYLAKRHCLQDWMNFSEKFAIPGTLGVTSASRDSDEGRAMKAAVDSFSSDWSGVLYGATGDQKDPIRLIQPNGNPSAMPMPALVERVDRKMAALYRGADLSTMSSKDGEGTGASLQQEETDLLEADDCAMISETLQSVERTVLEWHFGKGVEPLAYIEVQPPVREDKSFLLDAIEKLKAHKVRIGKADALERLGFSEADADEEALGEVTADVDPTDPDSGTQGDDAALEMNSALVLEDDVQALRTALAEDLQPVADLLWSAYQADDEAALQAALQKISEGASHDAPELAAAFENLFMDALLDAPEVEVNAAADAAPTTWKKFKPETGTLQIPRAVMPQIRNENRAAMINFLKARGVRYSEEQTTMADLKPVQAEYSPEKVEAAKRWKRGTRKLLVSADNYVVDGHHQWLSELEETPNETRKVLRLNAPIMHIIGLLLMMPSTKQSQTSKRKS